MHCDLTSLRDLRRDVHFSVCSAFYLLTLPSFLHTGSETFFFVSLNVRERTPSPKPSYFSTPVIKVRLRQSSPQGALASPGRWPLCFLPAVPQPGPLRVGNVVPPQRHEEAKALVSIPAQRHKRERSSLLLELCLIMSLIHVKCLLFGSD